MYSKLGYKELKSLFFRMYRIRLVEEEIAKRYSEQEMRCPIHLSTGQESAAVGTIYCLKKNDTVYSSHRSHAHYLAKSGDLKSKSLALHYARVAEEMGQAIIEEDTTQEVLLESR